MATHRKQASPHHNNIKLIYNPHAGKKRNMFGGSEGVSLEQIKDLLNQYQLPVDFFPTKKAGHATQLAKESVKEKYSTVIVAGGDGTVGEVANGLVGTDVNLGILPLGSFMNIARMLSIPFEIEKAIMLLKIGRVRKIDVGQISSLEGKKVKTPHYFLESAGIGIEAHVQKQTLNAEKGNFAAFFDLFQKMMDVSPQQIKIVTDDQEIETEATLVTVSNGPYTGAALRHAPEAKLNDHRLTVAIYTMSKTDLAKHFFTLMQEGKAESDQITTLQSKSVKLITKNKKLLHADGRVFSYTPAEFSVIPNALNVICGFPAPDEDSSLVKRTDLDP
jgi:diacylglycerol kinase (ATP)